MAHERKFKGKSLLLFTSDYTVVDIETNGKTGRLGKIIEISAIRIRKDETTDFFSTLINSHEKLSPFIKNLTGITDNMVSQAPEIGEVLKEFKRFLGNDIILGHNVHFDVNFLYDHSYRFNGETISNDMIDTLTLARRYLTLPRNRLDDLVSYYQFDQRSLHRALNDCYLTHLVYQAMRKDYENL
ncbi:3'-5' exonuclease [Lactococcus lactis]|uniref:3'-5' exonuclease n=1 Tax=Lactococcus lactis TaxID=1358 RepID=UPI00223B2DDE|nr:3'-5' exonuclease [Lactococcus lactis]MCT1227190.1 3'-5' exonuclease [Lactococcus lactis]